MFSKNKSLKKNPKTRNLKNHFNPLDSRAVHMTAVLAISNSNFPNNDFTWLYIILYSQKLYEIFCRAHKRKVCFPLYFVFSLYETGMGNDRRVVLLLISTDSEGKYWSFNVSSLIWGENGVPVLGKLRTFRDIVIRWFSKNFLMIIKL